MRDPAIFVRQRTARIGSRAMLFSMLFALLALLALLANIINGVTGSVIVRQALDPATLSTGPLASLSRDQLVEILKRESELGRVDGWTPGVFRRLDGEQAFATRSQADVMNIINTRLIQSEILHSYSLWESIFSQDTIRAEVNELNAARKSNEPVATSEWRNWLNLDLLRLPMNSVPALSGIRNAIFGSLAVIFATMLFAIPIGVGAAIYLEEYAGQTRLNQLIQTNINNLAGVPSIIYGMLGLFIFVRALEPLTSGAVFGVQGNNGRTILSAGLTMALLVLPIIIINAQEAIRAVPLSLRQASYGIGATKWETIRDHVLPAAFPGILTGTILAMSRAIGETAPMVVVGASTFIVTDPNGPFSKFTTLPIQIYNLTAQPGEQYRNVAAAAILVLLLTLLSLNMAAILLRNKYAKPR